jgi:hypothetical protein
MRGKIPASAQRLSNPTPPKKRGMGAQQLVTRLRTETRTSWVRKRNATHTPVRFEFSQLSEPLLYVFWLNKSWKEIQNKWNNYSPTDRLTNSTGNRRSISCHTGIWRLGLIHVLWSWRTASTSHRTCRSTPTGNMCYQQWLYITIVCCGLVFCKKFQCHSLNLLSIWASGVNITLQY